MLDSNPSPIASQATALITRLSRHGLGIIKLNFLHSLDIKTQVAFGMSHLLLEILLNHILINEKESEVIKFDQTIIEMIQFRREGFGLMNLFLRN